VAVCRAPNQSRPTTFRFFPAGAHSAPAALFACAENVQPEHPAGAENAQTEHPGCTENAQPEHLACTENAQPDNPACPLAGTENAPAEDLHLIGIQSTRVKNSFFKASAENGQAEDGQAENGLAEIGKLQNRKRENGKPETRKPENSPAGSSPVTAEFLAGEIARRVAARLAPATGAEPGAAAEFFGPFAQAEAEALLAYGLARYPAQLEAGQWETGLAVWLRNLAPERLAELEATVRKGLEARKTRKPAPLPDGWEPETYLRLDTAAQVRFGEHLVRLGFRPRTPLPAERAAFRGRGLDRWYERGE
jgi:hypothetical protein